MRTLFWRKYYSASRLAAHLRTPRTRVACPVQLCSSGLCAARAAPHSSAAPRARAGYGLARSASTDFVYTVYNTIVSGGAHDNANRNDLHNPLQ